MRPSFVARQACDFLSDDDKLRTLFTRVQSFLVLQSIWETVAPDNLAAVSHIGQNDAGEAIIYCDNGAAAAKLRQLLPTLAEALLGKGVATADLQVKVRALAMPVQTRAVRKREISRAGLENIGQLSDHLGAGALKSALDRLLARHRPD